jgi:hypothetical protein
LIFHAQPVRFLNYCQEELSIEPKQADFSAEFMVIVKTKQTDKNRVIK